MLHMWKSINDKRNVMLDDSYTKIIRFPIIFLSILKKEAKEIQLILRMFSLETKKVLNNGLSELGWKNKFIF